MSHRLRTCYWIVVSACLLRPCLVADEPQDFFERRVRPLLAANCLTWHGAKKQEAGLRLDSRQAILQGGASGAAVVAGQPEHSRLIAAVRWMDDLQMPPEEQLTPAAFELLEQWVKMGMPWPDDAPSVDPARSHWAFQPVRSPARPEVAEHASCCTAVDRFILAELAKQDLQLAPAADCRSFFRRAAFNLLGQPPTREQIEQFMADTSLGSRIAGLKRLVQEVF